MRGEDPFRRCATTSIRGSPPHARGRQFAYLGVGDGGRITPACAGKTCRGRTPIGSASDHPRMRGEDSVCQKIHFHTVRITPACAGKTRAIPVILSFSQDHPRMRGEDCVYRISGSCPTGSPPHARGRRSPCLRFSAWRGITPACAGKTRLTVLNPCPAADHPRMRGEDLPRRG